MTVITKDGFIHLHVTDKDGEEIGIRLTRQQAMELRDKLDEATCVKAETSTPLETIVDDLGDFDELGDDAYDDD